MQAEHINAQARLHILSQYIKDLSFENFKAPEGPRADAEQKLEIKAQINKVHLEEDLHEVSISLVAQVNNHEGGKQEPFFRLEIFYAGVFKLENIPQESLEAILLIEAPRYLFPFLRHAVASTTQLGGLPPLLIEPIDFAALYQQNVNMSKGSLL